MHRSMMQVVVKENYKAIGFYQKKIDSELVDIYPNKNRTRGHKELGI